MIEFRFEKPDGSMETWSPNQKDVDEWRTQFPSLDVMRNLESLAEWTWKNEGVKSKRRKLKTCMGWITAMLKKEWDKSESYSGISRARDALSKPAWEYHGYPSEEAYDLAQHEIHQRALQDTLPIPRAELSELGKNALDEAMALLAATPDPEPMFRDTGRTQLECEHEFKFSHMAGMICQCGMFESQFRLPTLLTAHWRQHG